MPRRGDPIAYHAELLGRVAIAWNNVQYLFFLVFLRLSGLPLPQAEAIFFTLRTDTAQREVVARVAGVVLKSKPELLARFKVVANEVGRLAGERNASMHTIWAIDRLSGHVTPRQGAPRHGALKEDFSAQFVALEKELGRHFKTLAGLLAELPRIRALLGRDRLQIDQLEASLHRSGLRSRPQSKLRPPRPSRA